MGRAVGDSAMSSLVISLFIIEFCMGIVVL